jgi:FtsZ-binding cell division protein ZapB
MKCKKQYKDQEKYKAYKRGWQQRYRNKTGAYAYKRRSWTTDEIEQVIKHEITDRELSEKIQRSVGAIQLMRYRIKYDKRT